MSMGQPAAMDAGQRPSSRGRSGEPAPVSSRGSGIKPPVFAGLELVDAFGEFYGEIVRLKRIVTAPVAVSAGNSAGAMGAEVVRQKLRDILEDQGKELGNGLPEHAVKVLEEAQYVMVAMADEVFLHLSWPGREQWFQKPLETHVFGTHDSGERIFHRLDQIFENRASASTDLLMVYMTALALGFKGRYAIGGAKTAPDEYRRRISNALSTSGEEWVRPTKELCPEALAHTESKPSRELLPSLKRGLYAILIVLVAWLVVGQIIWSIQMSGLNRKLDDIEELGGTP